MANIVNGFTANDPNCGVAVVPILLGRAAHDNVVLRGGQLSTSVLDFGTNDMLVGVTGITGASPGPTVSDAMDLKRTVTRKFR
jgi:hypothetical protein